MARFRPANLTPDELDRAFREAVERAARDQATLPTPPVTIGPVGSFAEDCGANRAGVEKTVQPKKK